MPARLPVTTSHNVYSRLCIQPAHQHSSDIADINLSSRPAVMLCSSIEMPLAPVKRRALGYYHGYYSINVVLPSSSHRPFVM